jgi:hypothetical protein
VKAFKENLLIYAIINFFIDIGIDKSDNVLATLNLGML